MTTYCQMATIGKSLAFIEHNFIFVADPLMALLNKSTNVPYSAVVIGTTAFLAGSDTLY